MSLPISEEITNESIAAILSEPARAGDIDISNRLAIQPMEGADSLADGSPGPMTYHRFERFARSGAGIIWFEAVAVCPEGRGNPGQLWLHEGNVGEFCKLINYTRETARKTTGVTPLLIMQATHSGRYSKPEGKPAPLIIYHNPIFEKDKPIDDSRIVSDDYLKSLEETFGKGAKLAEEAGFDGVDIKACHRYLFSELLSAYERGGEYGGSFENRTKLLLNAMRAARASISGKTFLTCRMNLYDGFPYPYGFGVSPGGGLEPVLGEAIRLAQTLRDEIGIRLLNYTLGNPYVNPHVNRPYARGGYEPPEHPLYGIERMCQCIGDVKRAVPDVCVIASGLSYLRQFSANYAAGLVSSGAADIAGYGRMALAYPQFAYDIITKGELDRRQCCITCGKCAQLLRGGIVAGCVVRDAEAYVEGYRKLGA